jgi:glucose/arabinose dehydrogenase
MRIRNGHSRLARAVALTAIAAAGACSDDASSITASNATAPSSTASSIAELDAQRATTNVTCDPDNGGITLPPGFCAVVVADQVGRARHVAASQNGDVYVALDDPAAPGGVLALRDRGGRGRADVKQYFGPVGANGIAVTNEFLYVGYRDRVVRWAKDPGTLVPTGAPQVVVSGLPSTGDHFRKTIQLDGRGALYVNIGSASNACQVQNRVLHSPGVDPCPELPIRAGVWRFDANRLGQTQSDGVRYAMGLRNVESLRWDETRGRLFGVQHGRDMLDDNWPELYTTQQGADLPSEEFVRIDQGIDNGWPYCYHDWQKGLKVLAPEYGGDGTIVGRCAGKNAPLLAFPGHWAPNDMLVYSGKQFPSRYVGGAFVAFHGGFDRAPLPNEGYNVVFVPFAGAAPRGGWEVFADGFTGGGTPLPANAAHRPMGLAQAPDGSLYVTDDKAGRVWRIVFRGR